jgi:hypothetical protein
MSGNEILDGLLKKANADEKKETVSAARVKKFNPKDLLKKQIHHAVDEELGEVCFGDLTIGDAFEVGKLESTQEKSLRILFLMLVKAYPELTFEEVKEFPQDKATRLIELIGKSPGFLRVPPAT